MMEHFSSNALLVSVRWLNRLPSNLHTFRYNLPTNSMRRRLVNYSCWLTMPDSFGLKSLSLLYGLLWVLGVVVPGRYTPKHICIGHRNILHDYGLKKHVKLNQAHQDAEALSKAHFPIIMVVLGRFTYEPYIMHKETNLTHSNKKLPQETITML